MAAEDILHAKGVQDIVLARAGDLYLGRRKKRRTILQWRENNPGLGHSCDRACAGVHVIDIVRVVLGLQRLFIMATLAEGLLRLPINIFIKIIR